MTILTIVSFSWYRDQEKSPTVVVVSNICSTVTSDSGRDEGVHVKDSVVSTYTHSHSTYTGIENSHTDKCFLNTVTYDYRLRKCIYVTFIIPEVFSRK